MTEEERKKLQQRKEELIPNPIYQYFSKNVPGGDDYRSVDLESALQEKVEKQIERYNTLLEEYDEETAFILATEGRIREKIDLSQFFKQFELTFIDDVMFDGYSVVSTRLYTQIGYTESVQDFEYDMCVLQRHSDGKYFSFRYTRDTKQFKILDRVATEVFPEVKAILLFK